MAFKLKAIVYISSELIATSPMTAINLATEVAKSKHFYVSRPLCPEGLPGGRLDGSTISPSHSLLFSLSCHYITLHINNLDVSRERKSPACFFSEHQHAEKRIFVPYLCPALNEKIAPTNLINVSRRIYNSRKCAGRCWNTYYNITSLPDFIFLPFFTNIDTIDFSWNSANERIKNILIRCIWTAMRIRRLKSHGRHLCT